MNRKHRSLIAFAALLLGSQTLFAQDKQIVIDRKLYPDAELVPKHLSEAPYAARRRARIMEGKTVELPDHVNNGEDKYFPPIFNQDGGSCGSAQSIGYMFTHEIDTWRDVDASLPENQYPTHFTWLLTYNGSDKEVMARTNGVPNVVTYGGRTYSKLFGSQTHDDVDFGWMQGYDKWYSAMWNRASASFGMTPTNTPAGRQELKEWLYDHCGDKSMPSGGVAGIGVAAYGTWKKIPSTAANKAAGVVGMSYVGAWGDTYNHALTVVGYDDRIEFDLDGDGKVGEVAEDEVGAWIIANSWGDGWENKGFIYCPYKYSYGVGTTEAPWSPGSYYIRRDYRPLRTIKLTMDYSHRSELLLCAGVSEDLDATAPTKTISFEHFKNAGNPKGLSTAPEVPMLGRWADGMHYEPMEFGYDLTDLTSSFDRTKPLKYFFIVKSKTGAIGKGHIYQASIMNYEVDNEGVEIPFDIETVEIKNKGQQTVISVIVPGEQLYAPTNLTLTDGLLTWTAPQTSSLPFKGYRVYQGELLVDSLPATQTQFRPAKLGSDPFAVSAVYQTGKYIEESAKSNPVAVYQQPTSGDNNVLVFKQSGLIIPNAVPEELTNATIEFWMRSDLNRSYVDQLGPGWGTFLFHTDNSGQLYAGWNTSSGDRMVINGIFKVGKWNHVAITIEGNKMIAYVNGTRKGSITSKSYSGLAAFGDLKMGHSGENQFWQGAMDEFRLWKKALTPEEIKANMKNRVAFPAMQKDLLVYLTMDTIEVDGEIRMRELVSGKHAKMQTMGTWSTDINNDILSETTVEHTAAIETPASSYTAGLPFTLAASSSVDAVDWAWHAEGARQADVKGMAPSFVFDKSGTYTVSLVVTYTDGTSATAESQVTVVDADAPVAAFDIASATLPAGDRFSFVNRSTGEGNTYVWSMPGAEVETCGGTNASALYPSLGTFNVTLTATNTAGSSSVTKQVTVTAAAPVALFDVSPLSVLLGDTVRLVDQSRYEPTSWNWELTNGHRGFAVSGQHPAVLPVAPGIYNVSLTTSNDLGKGTLTKNSILMVSNADARSALHFTGSEHIVLANPITESMSGVTFDWWMRPSAFAGSATMASASGLFSTSCGEDGTVTVKVDSKQAKSDAAYVILNEWHHYAIVIDAGHVYFYRDAILVNEASTRIPQTFPALSGDFTIGDERNSFNGLIDEFHIWTQALSQDDIRRYCNAPIADLGTAEAVRGLKVYYDFNQNGGDVIDRTSHGLNAKRVNFGPDGDAWNSALGVFTLDLGADPAGDITAKYLTNYKRPYYTAAGTVNPNNSSRFKKLEMGTARSAWQDFNAVKSGSIITGAHIDTDHNGDITFETVWSGFSENLLDYRLWQTVTLPAGRYTFSCTFSDGSDSQQSRIVACYGSQMVGEDECETAAIAWGKLTDGTVSFSLEQTSEVSLGIIINLIGQASFNISGFKLEGIPFEHMEAVEDHSDEYTYLVIPDNSDGVQPAKALYAYGADALAWHDFDAADPTQVWQKVPTADGRMTFVNVATGYVTTSTADGTLAFRLENHDGQGESGLAFAVEEGSATVEMRPITSKQLNAARVAAAIADATEALTAAYALGESLGESTTIVEPTAAADSYIQVELVRPASELILSTTAATASDRPSKVTVLASNDAATWTTIQTYDALSVAQPYGAEVASGEWSTGYLSLGDAYRYIRYEVNNINYAADGKHGLTDGRHHFTLASLKVYAPQVDEAKASLAADFAALVAQVNDRNRSGVAGDYDIQRLEDATLVFASYNSAAYASLAACVAEFNGDGNDYRSSMYERETADAYLLLLRAAQSALAERSSTDEEYASLEAELRKAYAAIVIRRDLEDGYYYIRSAYFTQFAKGMYAFDNDHVAWNTLDVTNPNFLWEVKYLETTRQGCRYTLRNVGTDRYLDYCSSDYAMLGDAKSGAQFICIVGEDTYAIRSEKSKVDYFADFHENGFSVGGRVAGAPSTNNDGDPLSWHFIAATDEQVEAAKAVKASWAKQTEDALTWPFTDEYPLITDATQLSTNSPAAGRANLGNLIDGRTSTYQTRSTVYEPEEMDGLESPWFEITFPRLVQRLYITTRAYSVSNTTMRPMRVRIAATDGTTWTDRVTIYNISNAYPQDNSYIADKEVEWQSPFIDLGSPATAVRFIVDEVNFRSHKTDNNLSNDFALSELQMYDADINVGMGDLPVSDALMIVAGQGCLMVGTPSSVAVDDLVVTSADGRVCARLTLAAGETKTVALPAGVYLVGSRKVIVR